MKWKAAKQYENRGVREVERFAYLPTRVAGWWVWLDYYVSIEEFYAGNWADGQGEWRVIGTRLPACGETRGGR